MTTREQEYYKQLQQKDLELKRARQQNAPVKERGKLLLQRAAISKRLCDERKSGIRTASPIYGTLKAYRR